jgi:hypothetical protein
MPLESKFEPAMRLEMSMRRRPIDNRLEVRLDVQKLGENQTSVTTIAESCVTIGDDMLFDRLQEHTNNYLRRFVNEWTRLEKTKH